MKKNLFATTLSLILSVTLFAGISAPRASYSGNNKGSVSVTAGLGMSKTIIGIVDTVPMFFTDTFDVWVKNNGPDTFNGSIRVQIAVDTSSGVKIFKTDTVTLVSVNSFLKNDSLLVTVLYTYTPANFRIGGNTIVIWPVPYSGTFGITTDSLKHKVHILPATGLREYNKDNLYKVFPNPVRNGVYIHGPFEDIEKLTLYDIHGRLLRTYPPSSYLQMEYYSPGGYFLEIVLNDKRRQVIRLMKH